jgi:hypothetical protein
MFHGGIRTFGRLAEPFLVVVVEGSSGLAIGQENPLPAGGALAERDDFAILDPDLTASIVDHALIVRRKNESRGVACAVDLLSSASRISFTRLVIEVRRRLVRQDNRRQNGQRSGNGHALTLAAAQLIRPMSLRISTGRRHPESTSTRFLRSRSETSRRWSRGYSTFSAADRHW